MRTALAVVAYNRREYLELCLRSLRMNPEADSWPTYFFFDGGPDSRQQELCELARSFEFGDARIVARDLNLGTGLHMVEIRRQLFDVEGYDRVMIIGEDVVLNPFYVGWVTRLMDWAEANFDDVGMATGWNRCHLPPEQKRRYLREVCRSNAHWITYLISSRCWESIREALYEFEDRFLLGRSYFNRDCFEIRKWQKALLASAKPRNVERRWVHGPDPDFEEYFGRPNCATGRRYGACGLLRGLVEGLARHQPGVLHRRGRHARNRGGVRGGVRGHDPGPLRGGPGNVRVHAAGVSLREPGPGSTRSRWRRGLA